jgi:tetratricopeptide (TPR) repeat protein
MTAVGLWFCSSLTANAKGLEDQDWIEIRTPDFQIQSTLSKRKTIELAQHLHLFRIVSLYMTNMTQLDSPVPMRIFAFSDPNSIRTLGLRANVVGFFAQSLRGNTIVIREDFGMEETQVIQHEYVHYLVRNQNAYLYPKWFDEGFAEYLGSARIRSGFLEIGAVPENLRVDFAYLNWVPLEHILDPDDDRDKDGKPPWMFYPESWALVHFLQNRSDRETTFGQDMARYIELVENGTPVLDAFEQAFGVPGDKLNNTVQRYLSGPNVIRPTGPAELPGYRLKVEPFLKNFHAEAVPLARELVSLRLGELALQLKKPDLAEHLFAVAAEDPDLKAGAEAGLGGVLKLREELDAALPHFERAVELAPDDPLCVLDLAEYWHDRAIGAKGGELRSEYFEKARTYYVRAWKLDATRPEVFARYGATFVDQGIEIDTAVEMLEHAQGLAPSDISVKLYLAKAYAAGERFDDAARLARSVLAWSHSESDYAKAAQEVLDSLPVKIPE